MKTLKEWQSQEKNLDYFLKINDEIDERFFYYFLEVLPPIENGDIYQISEASDQDKEGRSLYATVQRKGNKFYFLGYQKNCKKFYNEIERI